MKHLPIPKPGILFWILSIILTIFASNISYLGSYWVPQIEISLVFFLSVYLSINYWQLFLYGIFIDIVEGLPIGITALIIILIASIIRKFKNYISKQNTYKILLGFICTLVISNIIKYLFLSLYFATTIKLSIINIIIQILVNIVFYFILHLVLYNKIYMKRYEN